MDIRRAKQEDIPELNRLLQMALDNLSAADGEVR